MAKHIFIARKEQPAAAAERKEEANPAASVTAPAVVQQALDTTGKPLDSETQNFMESRFNHDFSNVKIHDNSAAAKSAESIQAAAYTSGNHIVFNSGEYNTQSEPGKRLLAHELTHVVQQSDSNNSNSIQRQPKDKNSPHNRQAVERAKRRLAFLKPRLDYVRSRQMAIGIDKSRAYFDRQRLDQNSIQVDWKVRAKQEEMNFSGMNTSAVDISVSDDAVVFTVKFNAFFHNPKAQNFPLLQKTLQSGIDMVWNQVLGSGVFQGRKFSVIPKVELITSLADRKPGTWLIAVRSSNTAPVTHPGCKLPQPPPGLPTSVTDTLCDNGVMNIPPAHLSNPGVLGHEMLHLFGLFDRYLMAGSGKDTILVPTRDAGDRKDPLGGDDATVLSEDLNYIFLKMGVFDKEELRSTAGLPLLEREVMKQERIIELGYDPDSLIRVRENFDDKMIKSAEDLD